MSKHMPTGIVKWLNSNIGYGFIKPDNEDNDIFVHITSLIRSGLQTLNQGQKVNFDVEPTKNKKHAVNIQVLNSTI